MTAAARFASRRTRRRLLLPGALAAFAALAALVGYGLWQARSMPIVRGLTMAMPAWPAGQPPLRIVLASDLHVADLGASRRRVARVVAQIDALDPDIVMLAGDFVGGGVQDHPERVPAALAPLAALKARLGVVAVLGNHDHFSDPQLIRRTLQAAGIRVLCNSATTIGPLVVGGIDDQFSHNAKLLPTEAAMARRLVVEGSAGGGSVGGGSVGGGAAAGQFMPRPMVILGHGPDLFPLERLAPLDIPLTLAGHTHCGQIALPFYGAIVVPNRTGRRYACGVYREGGRTLVVSGGVGTSEIPLRLFAPPDIWLITLVPEPAPAHHG